MTVCFMYYRRTLWFMLPMALIEAFSRVYLGVHYPSDVTVGALLGIAYAAESYGQRRSSGSGADHGGFPFGGPRCRPIVTPGAPPAVWDKARESVAEDIQSGVGATPGALDRQWVRLAYLLLFGLTLAHLIFLASGKLELSEDEAYQWVWSKHPALSYYSKPPLIAYIQFLGTHLWGDTQFGIRFFAPIFGAIGSALLIRFLAREANGRVAFLLVFIASATPLLMVGSTLLTIDSPSTLFWIAAMVCGWAAVERDSTSAWLWTGLWMGLGFLSKYTALFQWASWALFFIVYPKARAQLRRPGPYLALLINLLCMVPVVLWNMQHHWVTVSHLANRGGLDQHWTPKLRFVTDFFLSETFLLNPVFWLGMWWSALAIRHWRERRPVHLYLWSMGMPLLVFYCCFTLRARVQPNWIAPAVLPLFCLMLMYWETRWRAGWKAAPHWILAAMTFGWLFVIPLHDTRLFQKIFSVPLSVAE